MFLLPAPRVGPRAERVYCLVFALILSSCDGRRVGSDVTDIRDGDIGVDVSADVQRDALVDAGRQDEIDGGACQPLSHLDFGDLMPPQPGCPIDPAMPACASNDVGAVVARSNECLLESMAANGCEPWSHDFNFELVMFWDPLDGCEWPIVVDSVLDCGDHVEIRFSVIQSCESCDAPHPMWHIVHLPNDPKPVHALGSLVQEFPCP